MKSSPERKHIFTYWSIGLMVYWYGALYLTFLYKTGSYSTTIIVQYLRDGTVKVTVFPDCLKASS